MKTKHLHGILCFAMLCGITYAQKPKSDLFVYEGPGGVSGRSGRITFWGGERGPKNRMGFALNWPRDKRAEYRSRDECGQIGGSLRGDLRVTFDPKQKRLSWSIRDKETGVEASGSYPNSYCTLNDTITIEIIEEYFQGLNEGVHPRQRWEEVMQQLHRDPQRAKEVVDLIFDGHLKGFVEKYNLTDGQKKSAVSIMVDYQPHLRKVFVESAPKPEDLTFGESMEVRRRRAYFRQQFTDEIKDIFLLAEKRLEGLPTAAQREYAKEREKKKNAARVKRWGG